MTDAQLTRAQEIKAQIQALKKQVADINYKDISIGYLFNEAEIKQRKQEVIASLQNKIDELKEEFKKL